MNIYSKYNIIYVTILLHNETVFFSKCNYSLLIKYIIYNEFSLRSAIQVEK